MDDRPLTAGAPLSAEQLVNCPAPAKINLFLHVVGRRDDGYHLLQTAMRLLDWGDTLDFSLRHDGALHRLGPSHGIAPAHDLVLRAAQLLQAATGCRLGADIVLRKATPIGAGLGGGSSDAATTLIALNRLWGTGLSRARLQELALQLGADVPFFVFGQDAFVEGIGERLQPLALPPAHYVLLFPAQAISTAEVFADQDLTRNTSPIRMPDFAASTTRNDLQPVACRRYPEVHNAIEWLQQFAPATMTGSGSSIFAEVPSAECAESIVARCPQPWSAWKVSSVARHPLCEWLE